MSDGHPQSFGQELIERLLPHRYPFLLVDRVVSWTAGESLVAEKCVTANEPQFPGHFPGRPIMPGVLIAEALAQSCALLWQLSVPPEEKERHGIQFLAGIDRMRFKRLVVPGDTLRLEVRMIQRRARAFRLEGEATVGGELAARGELLSATER